MEASILKSTKKVLGLADDYTAFDSDVLLWINSAFSTLRDLGLGPEGFYVPDESTEWITYSANRDTLGLVQPYVYLSAKVMFDPPTTTHVMAAMQEQIRMHQYRLGNIRESEDWEPPEPTSEEVNYE